MLRRPDFGARKSFTLLSTVFLYLISGLFSHSTFAASIQYANAGSGVFRGSVGILDWADSALSNGISNGDTVVFDLPSCRNGTLTAQFSNVSNASNGATYVPTDMETFNRASVFQVYNTPGSGEALYGAGNADVNFRINWTLTIDGITSSANIILFDAEATNGNGEHLIVTTNGSAWRLIENAVGSDYDVTGIGTTTVSYFRTEGPGHSPILTSIGATVTDVQIEAGGRQGIAFGIVLPCDFGDAPASYGAATHAYDEEPQIPNGLSFVPGQLYLGNTPPDAEPDNQSDATANGDDADSLGDDEDGVTFPAMIQSRTATITTLVNGAGGFLQGWVDWDGDGTFTGSGEQIATNIQDGGSLDTIAAAGQIGVTVSVPPNAVTTPTLGRFRWSSQTNVGHDGLAVDGEVEDYSLTVTPAVPSLSIQKVADNDTNRAAGDVVTYTYTVTNTGNVDINDVTVNEAHNGSGPLPVPGTDTLLNDVAPNGDSTDAADDGSWDVLGPGDTITFTGTYTVTQSDVDTLQ